MKKLSRGLEALLTAILGLAINGLLVKLLVNTLGPAQGLEPITWLQGCGWLILFRALLGTGDIISFLKRGAKGER